MPSTPQRGFIVRPTLGSTEFESLNVQACSDPYPFTGDEVYDIASRWDIPVPSDTVSSRPVQERIKDKMLEKIEKFLESSRLNELSVLTTVYQKFKELHP